MADVFERAKVTYAGLKKTVDELLAELGRINTNAEKQRGLGVEAAKEIGRQVQKLKDSGKAGKSIADFKDDAEIKGLLKYVAGVQSTCDGLERDFGKVGQSGKSCSTELVKFIDMLDKEVKDRKKKRDRKIFSIDSKSLPDLESLLEKAEKSRQRLDDDVIMEVRNGFMITKGQFDRLIDTEVKETKQGREDRDAEAQGNQALDMRLFNRKSAEALKAYTSLVECCTRAAKNMRDDEGDKAKDEIETAKTFLKTLLVFDKTYTEIIARQNVESMKQGKDGKAILAKVATIKKNAQDGARLVKAASAKVGL